MRILLIGNYPPDGQESMLRFAKLMKEKLAGEGMAVTLLQPQPVFFKILGARARPYQGWGKWLGYLDKFVLFPTAIWRASRHHDVVHICDHSNAMYGRWTRNKPWLVTCNDLLAVRSALGEFPVNPTGRLGRLLQRWILSWLKRAPTVACISHATRDDLLRLAGRRPEHTPVIHMGLNHPYEHLKHSQWWPGSRDLLASHSIPKDSKIIFHVGGSQWYKNRSGVIRLFAGLAAIESGLRLLIAGKPASQRDLDMAKDLGIADCVHFLGAVSNSELQTLFHAAEFLLFPSLAEGFGWPVIEAQACGCRVAASNRPPLPEVGGKGCLYLDLDDEAGSITQLRDYLREKPQQSEARVAVGFQNLQRFRPEAMILKYVRLYHSLADFSSARFQPCSPSEET